MWECIYRLKKFSRVSAWILDPKSESITCENAYVDSESESVAYESAIID